MKNLRSGLLAKRVLASLVALALLCGFALPASAALDTTNFAAEVVRLVNEERAKEGLGALNFGNKALNDAAMQRAREFAANPGLKHTRPGNKKFSTVLAEYGIAPNTGWEAAGENVAEGYLLPERVVAGWMESPGHKKNILGGETDTGIPLHYNWIGVAVCEKDGRLYWAQLFITSSSLVNTGDANPAGSIMEPGSSPTDDDSHFFTDLWNRIMNFWDSIAKFFSELFRFSPR